MSNVFAKACRICLACRRTTFSLPCLIGVLVFSKATWHRSCVFVDVLVSFAPCLTVGCILQGLILTGILLSTNSYMCVHSKLLRIDVRCVKTTHGTACNLQQSRPPRCCGLTWHQLFLKVAPSILFNTCFNLSSYLQTVTCLSISYMSRRGWGRTFWKGSHMSLALVPFLLYHMCSNHVSNFQWHVPTTAVSAHATAACIYDNPGLSTNSCISAFFSRWNGWHCRVGSSVCMYVHNSVGMQVCCYVCISVCR